MHKLNKTPSSSMGLKSQREKIKTGICSKQRKLIQLLLFRTQDVLLFPLKSTLSSMLIFLHRVNASSYNNTILQGFLQQEIQ